MSNETDNDQQPVAGYHVSHEAWYWESSRVDETARITIGLYYRLEGGCDYEFSIVWREGLNFGTCHLHDDGFASLADPRFARFWAELAAWRGENITPDEVVAMLGASELVDLTERERS